MPARFASRIALIGTLLSLGACDAPTDNWVEWPEDTPEDFSFRTCAPMDVNCEDAEDMPDPAPNLADGPIQVHEGQSTTNPDCLIWDLTDGESGAVNNGPAANGLLGLTIMIERPDELVDLSGGGVCTIVQHPTNPRRAKLKAPSGEVLLSVKGRKIFDGDFTQLHGHDRVDALRYFYTNKHIRDADMGFDIVATATQRIAKASSWRKLALAALAEGYCGGNGLPREDGN